MCYIGITYEYYVLKAPCFKHRNKHCHFHYPRIKLIRGDQKVCVHLMITVQKTGKNILNSFSHLP
jgi:hypothetical protein